VQREISEAGARSLQKLAGGGRAIPVAGKPPRTGKFREALRDSRRRRGQFPRTPRDDGATAANAGAGRGSPSKGTGAQSAGSRLKRRSGDGSNRRRPGENELVP